jgi:hypothetical protein
MPSWIRVTAHASHGMGDALGHRPDSGYPLLGHPLRPSLSNVLFEKRRAKEW